MRMIPKKEHIANGIVTTIFLHLSIFIASYSNIGSVVGIGVGSPLRWVTIVVKKVTSGVGFILFWMEVMCM